MIKNAIKNFVRENGGLAMTETALLCFFLYVPVLMMVIIWGDMTLDKTRAHVAAAYSAFSGTAADTPQIQEVFFPGADGREDGLGQRRSAFVEDIELSAGPEFRLPETRAGDYSTEHVPEHDLQYRLYSMAMGHMRVTTHTVFDGGEVGLEHQIHQSRSQMARYLSEQGIVRIGSLPSTIRADPGEDVDIDTGADSRAYTRYVEVLTKMLNDALTGGTMPRGESTAVLNTRMRSPFFRELEREEDLVGGPRDLIGDGLPLFFEMQFGPPDQLLSPWREDESFHTGYAYLRNEPLRGYGGRPLLENLGNIGAGAVLTGSREMFSETVEGRDINPGNMPVALSESQGPDHIRFQQPGDPR